LCFGAALFPVGQVDVLEASLGVGGEQGLLDLRGQFALRLDAFDDGAPTGLHFAKISQAFLQGAELGVVQHSGRFLPVAGDEGNGRAAVQQVNCSLDLFVTDGELFGDGGGGIRHRGLSGKLRGRAG
jgi:hypothetical protein